MARTRLRPSKFPLSYLGDNPVAPPNVFVFDRAPTTDDKKGVYLGDFWIHKTAVPPNVYMLVGLSNNSATWSEITTTLEGGTTGQLLTAITGSAPVWATESDGDFTFTRSTAGDRTLKVENTDNTTATSNAILAIDSGGTSGGDPKATFTISGAITWAIGIDNSDYDDFKISRSSALGTNDAIIIDNTDNEVNLPGGLRLSSETDGVVQTSIIGEVSSSRGTDGQILISSTAGSPSWATITAGSNIDITNGANSITVETGGTVATTYTCDTDSASPSGGIIKILGGKNTQTSGDGNTITIDAGTSTYFEQLASDPTAPINGQVWYNTTSDTFKGAKGGGADVWITKANFPYSSYVTFFGSAGTPQESLNIGRITGGTVYYGQLYELLTNTFSLRQGKNIEINQGAFVGDSSDSGLAAGGYIKAGSIPDDGTEEYDGSIDYWITKTSLNQVRYQNGGAGDPTNAITFGGRISDAGSHVTTASTEYYDGTGDSWTNKASMNTSRRAVGGTGTYLDALSVGGIDNAGTSILTTVERYDGTGDSWTNKAAISSARFSVGCCSTAADALAIGGNTAMPYSSYVTTVEVYDGTGDSWSAGSSINVARAETGAAGSSSSEALICGGNQTSLATEYMGETTTIVTFTVT